MTLARSVFTFEARALELCHYDYYSHVVPLSRSRQSDQHQRQLTDPSLCYCRVGTLQRAINVGPSLLSRRTIEHDARHSIERLSRPTIEQVSIERNSHLTIQCVPVGPQSECYVGLSSKSHAGPSRETHVGLSIERVSRRTI